MRYADWERRLNNLIEERRSWTVRWGEHDCVTFAAECVRTITGSSLITPSWASEEEALDALDRAGGLIDAVTSVLGEPMQNRKAAQRGDVGLISWREGGNRAALGIVVGASVVSVGEEGLAFVPRSMVKVAWAVGR